MTRSSPGVTRPRTTSSATRSSSSAALPPFPQPGTGSIGAMRDDADLLDQVTQDIMESRRTRTLRLAADE